MLSFHHCDEMAMNLVFPCWCISQECTVRHTILGSQRSICRPSTEWPLCMGKAKSSSETIVPNRSHHAWSLFWPIWVMMIVCLNSSQTLSSLYASMQQSAQLRELKETIVERSKCNHKSSSCRICHNHALWRVFDWYAKCESTWNTCVTYRKWKWKSKPL